MDRSVVVKTTQRFSYIQRGQVTILMSSAAVLRKFSTATRIFRKEGIGGIATTMLEQIDVRLKLYASRNVESVLLDGCTFGLKGIRGTRMKLALLKEDYEEFERRAVMQYADREHPVIELGGCIGAVACITNRVLKHPASHVVVEANPIVLPLLKENRIINQCSFEILHAAIAYGHNSVMFSPSRDLRASSLYVPDAGRPVAVRALQLRTIVSEKNYERFTLICDIEGHEYDLVLNEPDVLQKVSTLILEIHAGLIGKAKTDQMLQRLSELGFYVVAEESSVIVMKRKA